MVWIVFYEKRMLIYKYGVHKINTTQHVNLCIWNHYLARVKKLIK